MGLIALFIKSVSRGPVLFKQERVGYMGKRFYCYKFRTMYVDSDISTHQKHFSDLMKSNGPMKKLDVKSDRRIIPFGKILRVCGLDELPQLLNVLKGDMSLIGPRPCIPYEYEQYQRWHRQRVDATPGLTGLWQVSGKNRTSFVEMMRLDIAYAKRRTLWMDLWILARTGPAMLVQVWDTACERARRRDAVGVPQLSRN
jgi:lipopolysaccharide/colanic/teichoic acid biosynthesis glycosyltransferase